MTAAENVSLIVSKYANNMYSTKIYIILARDEIGLFVEYKTL